MAYEAGTHTTRFWIMRHGQSSLNEAQCYQGCFAQSELTEHGIRSARLAAERLAGERIDVIYSSSLERAHQTAVLVQEVLAGHGNPCPIQIEDALREVELPGWEGLSYEAVRQHQPEAYLQFKNEPASFHLDQRDGKPIWPILELEVRVRKLMIRLVREHAGRNILLVTHGGPARILLLAALGLDLSYFHSIQQSHAGLSLVTSTAWSSQLQLELLNETHHTGESLPKLKEGKSGLRVLMATSDSSRSGGSIQETELIHLLENLPIHRVLAAGSDGVITAMRLLRYRGSVTVETCTEVNLCSAVQNQLRRPESDKLTNLLITGRSELLSRILVRSLQSKDAKQEMSFHLRSGLTVLHLPGFMQRPILQAVNTHQAGSVHAGGTQ